MSRAKETQHRRQSGPPARHGRAAALLLLILYAITPAVGAQSSRDIVLLLDNSGSMRTNDPSHLTHEAVSEFLLGLSDDTRVAVLTFDDQARLVEPLTPVNDANRDGLLASLSQVDFSGQYTDSPAAMERGIYELRHAGRTEADKLIIIVTDGIVDTGDRARDLDKTRWLREDLAAEAVEAGIRIFGIAFTDAADFRLLQTLARRTGGEYFRVYQAADLPGVFQEIGATTMQPVASAPALEQPETGETPGVPVDSRDEPLADEASPVSQAAEPPGDTPWDEAPPVTRSGAAQPTSWLVITGGLITLTAVVLTTLALRRRRPPPERPQPASRPPQPVSEPRPQLPRALLNDLREVTGQPTYSLSGGPTLIGRATPEENDGMTHVVIEDETIGRRHAIIEYRDYAYWLFDLDSVNGTYVNGTKITDQVPLKHGDRVRFYRAEFEFVMPDMLDSGMTLMSRTAFAGESGLHPDPIAEDTPADIKRRP